VSIRSSLKIQGVWWSVQLLRIRLFCLNYPKNGRTKGVSGFEFKVSGFGFQVSGFRFWVSDFGFRVFRLRVLGIRLRVSGLQVSGFGFRVSGFGFQVSGFSYGLQVSGFGFRVSDFGFRVSGSGWRPCYGAARTRGCGRPSRCRPPRTPRAPPIALRSAPAQR